LYNIIFVTGPARSNKHLYCDTLVQRCPSEFYHLKFWDLLREEVEKVFSPHAQELQNLREGLPGRPEVGVDEIEQRLNGLSEGDREKFILLDSESKAGSEKVSNGRYEADIPGFPDSLTSAFLLESRIGPALLIVNSP
jgi:hypothetical protein